MSELSRLQRLLADGRISRREFLSRATALGIAGMAPATLLSNAARAAPKPGGNFRIGTAHGGTTDSLDPGTYENDFTIISSFCRFNFLTEIAPNGDLIGELAESWESTPDAKVWTFKLRSGVEFHNGKTMDANDVIASFNHHRGEGSESAAKPLVDPISDITADGDRVVFTLKAGSADFPFLVSDYHLAIMPSADGTPDWKSAVGTGPFSMSSFDPGVRMELKKNANYWKSGLPYFDSISMIVVADVAARTNALITGEVDMMDRCEPKTLHLLERSPKVKVEETAGNGHYTIPMRTHLDPFQDNNIRQALKYAIDREKLLETVLFGHGYVGNDHPIGKGQRYFNSEMEQKTYDPDKAKWYLKEAGLDSIKLDLSAADAAFGGAVDAAVLYKEQAAAAGIDINVVREPNDGYWSNVWNTDNRSWCFSYWGGRPTEDWMFATAYEAGASWNESAWEHDRFNELLVAARAELDENKRKEMYFEMQDICGNEGGSVVPVFNNYIHATSDQIGHPEEMATNWANDGHKFGERWWFTS